MKVLMFGWEFPPHISGGLGTACYGLTKGLVQNDVEVLFVVPKVFGDEHHSGYRLLGANDVTVHTGYEELSAFNEKFSITAIQSFMVPYMGPEAFYSYTEEKGNDWLQRNKKNTGHQFEFSGKYGKDLLSEVWKYALVASEIAKSNDFDIIHAHDWLSFPAGIMAKEISGKPLVLHVHATEFDRSGEHINQQLYDIERNAMEIADQVISVSDYTRQIIINRYGIAPGKVITVHNAVDQPEAIVKPLVKKPREKIVCYLGRITFQKGPEYFVEAAKKVLERDPNVRFVMAGSGDMLQRMIKKAAEYRISSRFHFTGFLKGEETDRLLNMSNVYVMPSVSEPFGISPLEAIRSNVPVIISKQSGVKEVLPNAIKINFWDTDAMANAIHAMLHYNGLSKMLKSRAKEDLGRLRWDTQAAKVKQLYETLINN
jgi:glycosyltransferase involved in cell wall biosynthesis